MKTFRESVNWFFTIFFAVFFAVVFANSLSTILTGILGMGLLMAGLK